MSAIPQLPLSDGDGDGDERLCWEQVIRARLQGRVDGHPKPELPDLTEGGRLDELVELFGLSALDKAVLAVLWASAYSPELGAAVVELDPGSGQITPRLVSSLFGQGSRIRLPSESPLMRWHMVREHPLIDANAALSIDPQVVAWLDGQPELDRDLVGRAEILPGGPELAAWPTEHTAARIRAGMADGLRWRICVLGEDPTAARAFAAAVAARLGLPMLGLAPGVTRGEDGPERLVRVHRQAFLDRVAPLFDADDATLAAPAGLIPFPVQFVVAASSLAPVPDLNDLVIRLEPPGPGERRALWLDALPECAAWPGEELDDLALRYDLDLGEIRAAASAGPADAREAALRVREASRDDLGGLAQRLECGFAWDDLVLPGPVSERLEDIAFEARERAGLWAQPEAARLYPQGRGLVALFSGPPGTGKTMAAQVIAGELGLDLLRIDLSAVLSKWVGETAQNLQRILSARVGRRSLLFFDEADALYGKRVEELRDAQDRYLNMDVSHLMVALEAFEGIVLLATNLRANIDPAFIRRIRHLVEFPRPDQQAREAIWRKALTALFGPDGSAVDQDLEKLARLEATGAQIKNAALSAAFAARRNRRAPDLALLGAILARELAKDGAGLSRREVETTLELGP